PNDVPPLPVTSVPTEILPRNRDPTAEPVNAPFTFSELIVAGAGTSRSVAGRPITPAAAPARIVDPTTEPAEIDPTLPAEFTVLLEIAPLIFNDPIA